MTAHDSQGGKASVAVVGGGLAGMAATVALAECGCRVGLFEAHTRLGGRAASFRDPQVAHPVDYCQHVSMGCCANLADFCRRIGVADCFGNSRTLHFFGPDGSRHDFAAATWLPAPLHLLPGLMRLRYLSLPERLGLIRAIRQLTRKPLGDDRKETAGQWLRRHGQSPRAIEQFWSVVLVSALSETVDRVSPAAAAMVFLNGFLASRRAYELEVPQVPLDDMFHRRATDWFRRHDVTVATGTRIGRIDGNPRRATGVVLPDGTLRAFDFVVTAVPWRRVRSLFSEAMLSAMPALDDVKCIHSAPLTAVHLWLDRSIMQLRYDALRSVPRRTHL